MLEWLAGLGWAWLGLLGLSCLAGLGWVCLAWLGLSWAVQKLFLPGQIYPWKERTLLATCRC